jgi:hypothetical protein
LLTILISFQSRAEDLAIPIKKGQPAQFDGVLITRFQAADYVGAKTSFQRCIDDLALCNIEKPGDNISIPEVLYFFGGGALIGLVVGFAAR